MRKRRRYELFDPSISESSRRRRQMNLATRGRPLGSHRRNRKTVRVGRHFFVLVYISPQKRNRGHQVKQGMKTSAKDIQTSRLSRARDNRKTLNPSESIHRRSVPQSGSNRCKTPCCGALTSTLSAVFRSSPRRIRSFQSQFPITRILGLLPRELPMCRNRET